MKARTATKKITLFVQADLLKKAQKASKKGITSTINQGLELLAAADAYRHLLALKGKERISLDLDELRKDR